ncbi:hypothetical protein [Caviibacterium pharyngocola]|uniref:Uncharacterized protein n=1 Tax=Caviibacterium pharyngocola TaxID=28159 RepID=A0A2M8RTK2_9PAST|nr:hypothetical protein [Caviibacterium pharyngocola]PJG82221.1 hypothetical protein CVP04_10180 [Caviibacterium pharyngocola]
MKNKCIIFLDFIVVVISFISLCVSYNIAEKQNNFSKENNLFIMNQGLEEKISLIDDLYHKNQSLLVNIHSQLNSMIDFVKKEKQTEYNNYELMSILDIISLIRDIRELNMNNIHLQLLVIDKNINMAWKLK